MNLRITQLFKDFTSSEKNAGLVLICCTMLSLFISNSSFTEGYLHFWHQKIGFSFADYDFNLSVEHWINDGLMTIFFLLVGLEIERELYAGELHPIKNALLPVICAIGGMIAPAMIFGFFNFNTDTINGFGIPMGTDIAFALGIISLAGNRVPVSIKVLLTAIAIIDDLGSILVIALFYGSEINFLYLGISLLILVVLFALNRLQVHKMYPYLILGFMMWFFMMQSGIHPTISGVLLAFAIPFGNGDETSISIRLQGLLHIPVAFIILPIFTLANTAIPVKVEFINSLFQPHTLGICFGLLLGKPIGIISAFYLAVKVKISQWPGHTRWSHIIGLGCIAGIGFTMSIFITQLAFTEEVFIQSSKLMILLASALAASIGLSIFYLNKPHNNPVS
jgi:Na+:H+ antiporter, NhaA family